METRLVNQHLYRALRGSNFRILDITHMSEFRADAHPSTTGGKIHDDCMHWCLPGLTDTWNDLFIAQLNSLAVRNWFYIALSVLEYARKTLATYNPRKITNQLVDSYYYNRKHIFKKSRSSNVFKKSFFRGHFDRNITVKSLCMFGHRLNHLSDLSAQ